MITTLITRKSSTGNVKFNATYQDVSKTNDGQEIGWIRYTPDDMDSVDIISIEGCVKARFKLKDFKTMTNLIDKAETILQ